MKHRPQRLLSLLLALAMVLSLLPAALAAPELPEITLPNGDFELGNTTGWVVSGLPADAIRTDTWNEANPSWALNLWASDTDEAEIHASYPVKLTAGTYQFSFLIGGDGKDSNLKWTVKAGEGVPSNSIRASSTISFDSMSRWLVGSSSTSVFAPESISLSRESLAFSPPERSFTCLNTSSPVNRNRPSSDLISVSVYR